ncbi:hypothetical protein JOC77_000542 [Peribacillus deserti]|uniref:Phage protein n=1 Tax=Peribacillus deserti TaxID=673318 RepID=A0ABS2QDG3_9BACI|nr:hypothetical protein [Peribacillus deserti]MBM7691137.1 hypothetical protein [Peribacillus deserti]
MEFMEIVKADAFWGLVGAVIGGAVSIIATVMQIKAQNKAQEKQKREQHDKTMTIIVRFIKNEVRHNYEVLEEVNKEFFPLEMIKNFTYDEFIQAFRSHYIKERFEFETDHYDKFKYEIAYMENRFANEIIDFYDMFEMIRSEDYREWSKEQFENFKETLVDLNFFIHSDYDHW